MRKSLQAADVGVQEMADYLGVSRGSVGNWINGKNRPSKQTMMLWALRCGVPLTWLETGEVPGKDDPGTGHARTSVSMIRLAVAA